jgi:hypothetical protein
LLQFLAKKVTGVTGKHYTGMRKNYCKACSFAKHGVKTRIAIPHTCGIEGVRLKEPPKYQYVPTREELDKYLARLKELMEGEG